MVRKAGNASVILSKLIFTTDEIMNKPTRTNAGAVAETGTIRKRGARNRERTNMVAVERAVKPVRPPTATPEALSTYEVTVLVPRMAPKAVPSASANSAFLICGKLPSLSVNPIFEATPSNVPIVSNRFTNRKVNTTISISGVNMLCHSNCRKIGEMSGGRATMLPVGICTRPKTIAKTVAATIPIRNAPCTFLKYNTAVRISPKEATHTCGLDMVPSVSMVFSFFTTSPAFCRPRKVMKSPIPTGIAFLMVLGILFTINSRTLKKVRIRNIIPSINTAVSAICQEYPSPSTTEKAKKEFNPMPGACAMGRLGINAINSVPSALASAVAVNRAPLSIPAALNILGFTTRMYDIVRKVITPATISVRTVVLCCVNLNIFSNIIVPY